MFYYTYRVTNNETGMEYIGVHQSASLENSYMGGGELVRWAQRLYGEECFTKEILEVFETSREAYNAEADLVTQEYIDRSDNYNLCVGGKRRTNQTTNCVLKQEIHRNVIDASLAGRGDVLEFRRQASDTFMLEL